jgi:hypothetical protein
MNTGVTAPLPLLARVGGPSSGQAALSQIVRFPQPPNPSQLGDEFGGWCTRFSTVIEVDRLRSRIGCSPLLSAQRKFGERRIEKVAV